MADLAAYPPYQVPLDRHLRTKYATSLSLLLFVQLIFRSRCLPFAMTMWKNTKQFCIVDSIYLKSDYSKWISWSQTSIINTFPSNLTYIYPYYQRSSQSDAGDVNLSEQVRQGI